MGVRGTLAPGGAASLECGPDFCADVASASPARATNATSRTPISTLTWLCGVLGIALLILANSWLNEQRFDLLVAVVLLAGLAVWAVSSEHLDVWFPKRAVLRNERWPARWQWLLLGITVASGAGAVYWSRDNEFRTAGVICWIAAIVSWTVGWWPKSSSANWLQRFRQSRSEGAAPASTALNFPGRPTRQTLAICLAMLLILAVGTFFLFYQIDKTPRDPTSDHAEKLADVQTIIDGGRPIFFENNTGREPMQFYLIYTMVDTFDSPLNFTTMKVGTAFVGLLSIPFVYLLAAELGGVAAGLAASLLMAIGKWPVEISRAGLRFPYGMTFAAITLWFLVRWMRTGDRRDALACGLALGAGLYGYTPFRAVVPVVAIGFLLVLLAPTKAITRKRAFGHGLLTAATALVVFLPLGTYGIEKPDNFWQRSTNVVAGKDEASALRVAFDQLSVFLENNWHAALAFTYRGDSTMVNAVTYDPFLDVVMGALLLAGLVVALRRIVRRFDRALVLLLVALPVLFLPSTLALAVPYENPSVNRAGSAIPLIFALCALPLAILAQSIRRSVQPRLLTALAATVLTVLLGIAAYENFERYYRDFDRQTRLIVVNTTEIAAAIDGASSVGVSLDNAYIIDRAYWLDIRNIGLTLGNLGWAYDHNIGLDDPLPERRPGEPLFLVLHYDDAARLAEILLKYPDGHLTRVPAEIPGQDFLTYLVLPDDAVDESATNDGQRTGATVLRY